MRGPLRQDQDQENVQQISNMDTDTTTDTNRTNTKTTTKNVGLSPSRKLKKFKSSSMMQGQVLLVEQHRSKRRRLVLTTFFGSVASLLFAIAYDYVRPRLVHEVVPLLQHSLGAWKYFAGHRHGPLLSPQMLILMLEMLLVCPTVLAVLPFTRQLTASVGETTTDSFKNDPSIADHSTTTATMERHAAISKRAASQDELKITTSSKEILRTEGVVSESKTGSGLRRVLLILEGTAWFLWTLAAIVFLMGILYTKIFGVISFSALLALFAQGIQAVKIIGSHRLDDDDVDDNDNRRFGITDNKHSAGVLKRYNSDVLMPSRLQENNNLRPGPSIAMIRSKSHGAGSTSMRRRLSNDKEQRSDDVLENAPRRRASSWAEDNRTNKVTEATVPSDSTNTTDEDTKHSPVTSPSSPRSCPTTSTGTTTIKSGEKLDVFIFFLVSSCLLLSPYYLHVGIQFIFKACWGCVHGSQGGGSNNHLGDEFTSPFMNTAETGEESINDNGSIFERFNATMRAMIPLLFQSVQNPASSTTATAPDSDFVDRRAPGELLAVTAFVTTILIPIMTHGVGGAYFVGFRKGWDFYHPFRGGRQHVTAQALGWTLLFLAGLLQLLFLIKAKQRRKGGVASFLEEGEEDDLSLYLWHGGSWLSMMAHGSLLGSILLFRQGDTFTSTEAGVEEEPLVNTSLEKLSSFSQRTWFWFLVSIVQDVVLTNMHWFYAYWITSAAVGFDAFSLDPAANLFQIPFWKGALNMLKTIMIWFLWTFLVPYSPRRKIWKYNIFGKINEFFEYAAFHPNGLFCDSQLRHEEPTLEHYRKCHRSSEDGEEGQVMFCIMPHGTLPTSVMAVWYQFRHFFDDVCCFFGSQVALVPGYRYILAMRGGFMPVNKQQVIRIMKTRQSVSLVPGGVSEMMHCEAHSRQINVSIKHKGFVRLALQHGYDLVPLFFFHSNDQYDNPLKGFQSFTYKICGLPVGLPWYTNKYRLPVSNRTPIRMVLGRRIGFEPTNNGVAKMRREKISDPTMEQIDEIHRQFYEEVYRIFEKYKHEFGYGDRELTYVS